MIGMGANISPDGVIASRFHPGDSGRFPQEVSRASKQAASINTGLGQKYPSS